MPSILRTAWAIPLSGFWTGNLEYIFNAYGCTESDIGEYPNYSIDLCGPRALPVSNGNVGDFTYDEFESFIAESLTWEITSVNFKVMLEGAYNGVENEVTITDVWTQLYFPWQQPFNITPYNYDEIDYMGDLYLYDIVDWVLVEARLGTPQISGERGTETVEMITGLVTATGDIINTQGNSLKFKTLDLSQSYYFCIRHRNHLDVLTARSFSASEDIVYDFTTSVDQAFGYGQQKWSDDANKAMMYVGDFNQDGVIQLSDYDAWRANPAQVDVYSVLDGTLDGTVQVTDYDAWLPNKAKIGVVEIGF